MLIPLVETFFGFQGEGRSVGQLSYFIRVPGCSLSCKFCDSKYASHATKKNIVQVKINDLVAEIENFSSYLKRKPQIVITGGEPLLYKEQIKYLVSKLYGYNIEIETNGTISPLVLSQNKKIKYNVSPKLLSSGNDPSKAIKPLILKQYLLHDSIFKFVIRTKNDWIMAQDIIKKIKIKSEMVYIMPEGQSDEIIKKHALKFYFQIIASGYNFSPRIHIWLFGKKRGV